MKKIIIVFLIVLLFTLPIISLNATKNDDWPMFMHDPQHTGYTDCEMPDELELLWKYETGGSVRVSPTMVSGKVYVGSNDSYVYCLNASTGKLVWKYETGRKVDSSSPTVVDGKVYIGSFIYLYCLDADTGELIWKYHMGWFIESSPSVVTNKIYIGSGFNYVHCVNANTGKIIWKYMAATDVKSSPAVAYGKIYIGSDNNHIYCLDANTGRLVWKYKTGEDVCSSPAVADGKVYIGSNDCYIYCLNVDTGKFIWKYTTGGFVSSSPAIVSGKIYVGSSDNYIYCFGSKKETPSPTTIPVPTTSSFEITSIEAPPILFEGEAFTVEVTTKYSFSKETRILLDIYEHAGPLLSHKLDTLSGAGFKTYEYKLKAPSKIGKWQLNIHPGWWEGDTHIPGEFKSIAVEIKAGMLSTTPPATPASTTPVPTTKPTTSPPPTTTPIISPTTTTPFSTTSPQTTPPPVSPPSFQSNYLLYIGLFVAMIVILLAIYQVTKKKPAKVEEKKLKKEKLSTEKRAEIKTQIGEKKKYIENYKKIMEQDPTKKEMAEKLIRQYEEEIKELERKVRG